MAIELKDVETIAHLARLRLESGEKQEALESINNILRMIDQMQALDTATVEPLAHAFEAGQRLREDRVTEQDQRAILLALAPEGGKDLEKGLFLVPKVLE